MYLSLGMKLTKVHRVLKFKQPDWLKKYPDFDTGKRKMLLIVFEKDFFKLMNRNLRKMGNLRKRINVRFVNNAEDYKTYVRKPSFVSQKMFSKNFAVIHEIKPVLTLDKPIYVGFSIPDLSKYLMY